MNYFDYNTPDNQRRAEAREPKNEFDAMRALKAPHRHLSERELATFIGASIVQARRAKGRK